MHVRIAVEEDILELMLLQSLHHFETSEHFSNIPIDYSKCKASTLEAINSDKHLLLVVESEGELIGYFWLVVIEPHFCEGVYANELFLFVDAAHRSGRAMLLLLNEGKKAAKEIGCMFLQVGTLGGSEKQEQTYEKRYRKIGSIYHIDL